MAPTNLAIFTGTTLKGRFYNSNQPQNHKKEKLACSRRSDSGVTGARKEILRASARTKNFPFARLYLNAWIRLKRKENERKRDEEKKRLVILIIFILETLDKDKKTTLFVPVQEPQPRNIVLKNQGRFTYYRQFFSLSFIRFKFATYTISISRLFHWPV